MFGVGQSKIEKDASIAGPLMDARNQIQVNVIATQNHRMDGGLFDGLRRRRAQLHDFAERILDPAH